MTETISSFTGGHYFLSNFYASPFLLPGISDWWHSAEHAFQAAKATTPAEYRAIRDARSPAEAKRLGRAVMLHPGWDAHKREVMLRVLLAKFESGPLREQLIATAPAALIESNTWGDTYWGAVGESQKGWSGPRDLGYRAWHDADHHMVLGHNWLGRLLMVVREVCLP